MKQWSPVVLALGFYLLIAGSACSQTSPKLVVTAPAVGSIAKPGENMSVVVRSQGLDSSSASIFVIGPDAISEKQILSATNVFNIHIPEDADPGEYLIRAVAYTVNGAIITSSSISIMIPVTFAVDGLEISNRHIHLLHAGEQDTLVVRVLTRPRGRLLRNEELSFKSANPSVVTVDAKGEVTAHAAGTGQVIVSYGGISTSASIVVTGSDLRGDLLGHGQVDIHDVEKLEDSLNTSASGADDARDINHDGVIDEKDVALEKALCTYRDCKPHK